MISFCVHLGLATVRYLRQAFVEPACAPPVFWLSKILSVLLTAPTLVRRSLCEGGYWEYVQIALLETLMDQTQQLADIHYHADR